MALCEMCMRFVANSSSAYFISIIISTLLLHVKINNKQVQANSLLIGASSLSSLLTLKVVELINNR